jgi:predicted MFS family arabinose efflux permease
MHRNIKILLSCSILIHGGVNLLAPIYAIFIKNIGGSLIDASLTIGVYACLKGILYFVFRNQDEKKVSRRFMIAGGYFLFFVGYVLYLFASKTMHVLGIQALLAFAEVIINPSWSAVIANALTKGKERGIYSDFYGYRSMFEGIAAVSGGFLATYLGFNTLFILMAVFALSASVLALFLETTEDKEKGTQ